MISKGYLDIFLTKDSLTYIGVNIEYFFNNIKMSDVLLNQEIINKKVHKAFDKWFSDKVAYPGSILEVINDDEDEHKYRLDKNDKPIPCKILSPPENYGDIKTRQKWDGSLYINAYMFACGEINGWFVIDLDIYHKCINEYTTYTSTKTIISYFFN